MRIASGTLPASTLSHSAAYPAAAGTGKLTRNASSTRAARSLTTSRTTPGAPAHARSAVQGSTKNGTMPAGTVAVVATSSGGGSVLAGAATGGSEPEMVGAGGSAASGVATVNGSRVSGSTAVAAPPGVSGRSSAAPGGTAMAPLVPSAGTNPMMLVGSTTTAVAARDNGC
ncbi:MAG: hypothetical protein IPP16_06155 [Acidimicrobiaceae bacterium]|nr:hypothetical protein [Acidimicrobiaceae bacterium]